MQHREHVNLIKKAIIQKHDVWADFGSGDGAFTLAVRDLAGPEVEIYSIDKDGNRLKNQKEAFNKMFPKTNIHYIEKDFINDLQLPQLDGIIMANSLHYVQNQLKFLQSIKKYFKSEVKLLLVEYNTEVGNQWVPYPLSFPHFESLAKQAGFRNIELLEKIPSTYWEEMYSSQAVTESKNV